MEIKKFPPTLFRINVFYLIKKKKATLLKFLLADTHVNCSQHKYVIRAHNKYTYTRAHRFGYRRFSKAILTRRESRPVLFESLLAFSVARKSKIVKKKVSAF